MHRSLTMLLTSNQSGRRVFFCRLIGGAVLSLAGAKRLLAADKLDPADPYA